MKFNIPTLQVLLLLKKILYGIDFYLHQG